MNIKELNGGKKGGYLKKDITSILRNSSIIGFIFGVLCGNIEYCFWIRGKKVETIIVLVIFIAAFNLYKHYFCIDDVEQVYITQLNGEPDEEFLERIRKTIEEAGKTREE